MLDSQPDSELSKVDPLVVYAKWRDSVESLLNSPVSPDPRAPLNTDARRLAARGIKEAFLALKELPVTELGSIHTAFEKLAKLNPGLAKSMVKRTRILFEHDQVNKVTAHDIWCVVGESGKALIYKRGLRH